MSQHNFYKYSITIYTEDLAVVNCLRALSKFSQKTGNNNIPWGGTKDVDWKRDSNKVTFRFSKSEYRTGFISEINRLLPNNLWEIVESKDDNPAKPIT